MISDYQKIQLFLGNVFPLSLAPSHRQDFTPAEQKKYERIRAIVEEVGEKVGIAYPKAVKFRVTKEFGQNACMVGNMISFDGPVMCLANDYFTYFEAPEISSNTEYWEWRVRLKQIPDHPVEMGKWLSSRSPEELRRIHTLTKKFKSVLDMEELKGMIAHELGHAKHLHTWKKLFFLLPLSWGIVKVGDAVGPVLGKLGYLPAFILFSLAMSQVSQVFEKEADEETAVSHIYCAGLKNFFKRHTILKLTAGSSESAVKRVESMVQGFDFGTHPHPAKRVIAAIERKERPAYPISIWEQGIAFVGGALLVREVVGVVADVWNRFFGKKTKQAR